MMRTFARRFNRMYKVEYFPVPVAYNFGESLIKIPGLDGSGKMGKSEGEGNAIFLTDEPNVIKKKIMRAVTDAGPTEKNQVKPEPIQNIFSLMQVVSSHETAQYFEEQYNTCTIRYGDMKKQLAEDMNSFIAPIRERIKELSENEAYLSKVAHHGAEKARESASKTIREVREIIGFKKF
jgi:tryptophanyl-tRNA synthetase